MKTPFKCPYNDFSCVHVDTCGMSVEKSCSECNHSHNKTRATGAMPGLEEFVNFFKTNIRNHGFTISRKSN